MRTEPDEIEEGQITLNDIGITEQLYDVAYEWPGEEGQYRDHGLDYQHEPRRSSSNFRSNRPVFRFLVLGSSILPSEKKIAVVDTYTEVQFGRDLQPEGSGSPRIRLKEMEVSKIHATAFWDGSRKEWNVVDMGSKHGTFLHSGPISPKETNENRVGTRLSQSRTASIPRRLRHSDQLTVGSTTFEVHMHDNQRPCVSCAITGNEEIPLFPSPKGSAVKRSRDTAGIETDNMESPSSIRTERNPKKALTMLKRSLLTRHDPEVSNRGGGSAEAVAESSNEYVDRAARRRFLHPSSHPDTPGVPAVNPSAFRRAPVVDEPPKVSAVVVSQPATPLPSSNIGHRLLMQQGWAPGESLGNIVDGEDERRALVDPLEVRSSQRRAGLGMKSIT